MSREGRIFVLSAPSGTGKSTVGDLVRKKMPELGYSVSLTTRSPRAGEVNGKDYFFVTKEEFLDRIDKGLMVEYAKVYDNYYGTSQEQLETTLQKGRDIFLDIEIKGASQMRKRFPKAVFIFLLPPSIEELERRLRARATETEEELVKRLGRVTEEMAQANLYDYNVVNDDLSRTVDDIIAIIRENSFVAKAELNAS